MKNWGLTKEDDNPKCGYRDIHTYGDIHNYGTPNYILLTKKNVKIY